MERYSDERLERAVEALSDPERFREAEAMIQRAAPKLQRILNDALAAGGWFGEAHTAEVRKALEVPDDAERSAALRTLLAEEARIGMMVGVAVGWELRAELSSDESQ